jgi:hypothetical protein
MGFKVVMRHPAGRAGRVLIFLFSLLDIKETPKLATISYFYGKLKQPSILFQLSQKCSP